jgi:hypothetical protein
MAAPRRLGEDITVPITSLSKEVTHKWTLTPAAWPRVTASVATLVHREVLFSEPSELRPTLKIARWVRCSHITSSIDSQ